MAGLLTGALISQPAQLVSQVPARWHLVEEARFGSRDTPNAELTDIRGFVVSAQGNVVVLDYKTQDLRVFGPSGTFLRAVGRKGAGPGEFSNANGMAQSPDGTIWVNDPGNGRYSIHAADGRFIRDVPSGITSYGFIWDGRFDAKGRLLSAALIQRTGPDGKVTRTFGLERRAVTSGISDTVKVATCTPKALADHPRVNNWQLKQGSVTSVPYQPGTARALHPDGYAWCGNGSEYTIIRLGLAGGDTQATVHGHGVPVPVTSQERAAAINTAKAWARKIAGRDDEIHGEDVPTVKPLFTNLYVDDKSRLWVRLTSADSTRTNFDVFDQRGRPLASVDASAGLMSFLPVVIRGEKLYAVIMDADDIPTIVRYRIQP